MISFNKKITAHLPLACVINLFLISGCSSAPDEACIGQAMTYAIQFRDDKTISSEVCSDLLGQYQIWTHNKCDAKAAFEYVSNHPKEALSLIPGLELAMKNKSDEENNKEIEKVQKPSELIIKSCNF
jgi:hypothetical protein